MREYKIFTTQILFLWELEYTASRSGNENIRETHQDVCTMTHTTAFTGTGEVGAVT